MMRKLAIATATLLALGLAQSGFAEDVKPADTKTTATDASKKKPVDVEADSMEVMDKEHKAIFRGNVVAKRPDVTLTCEVMAVDYDDTPQPDGTSKNEVTHIDATGKVVIVTAKERITGDWAKINPKSNDIEVGGTDVMVTQGSTILHGTHLHDNLDTHKMELTGGRVKGSFLPK